MFRKNRLFAEVFNELYPLVFSTVYGRVNNIDDAEDICQEVFIHFYQKQDEIEDSRKWLYGALRLEVLSYYRKKKGAQVSLDDVFQDESLSFFNGARDVRLILEDALNHDGNYRDSMERSLFELIALKKFTYDEAASELGFTRRQARYKYGVIVKRILDYLSKKGITDLEDIL